ncbi:MAG TPA: ornithine cyclodeaminase family protein [Blastocatellia bacterium]|nr:ornithine cyclodeaminase family protein [Blastocatellia bacterium]
MRTLVLNHSDVVRMLPAGECIEVMAGALTALANGKVFQPLRTAAVAPGAKGILGLMPSYMSGASSYYGLKAVCVFPGNSARGLDSHQGAVLLFSGETGELLAVVNASAITSIRTAAVSALATRLLAQPDAGDLAIIGAGVQARVHLDAIACVRPIRRVRVASRNFDSARAFVDEVRGKVSFPIDAVETVQAALVGADLIVTATTSREPILKREWVASGAHLNVVGSSVKSTREIDTATMAAASLFVDRRESTLNESGDYLFAAREGAIGPDHIKAELGEILAGQRAGRASEGEITLFKSLGLGVEDLASAEYLYRKAGETGAGIWTEF